MIGLLAKGAASAFFMIFTLYFLMRLSIRWYTTLRRLQTGVVIVI